MACIENKTDELRKGGKSAQLRLRGVECELKSMSTTKNKLSFISRLIIQ